MALPVGILDEEHVVDDAEQCILQTVVLLVGLEVREIFLHLLLRVYACLETVAVAADPVEEEVLGLLGVLAEEVSEHPFQNKGIGLYIRIDPEVVAVAELVGREGESRVEITEQAMHGIERNLPYAEESEDMVDTVGVEILRHLAEAVLPPLEAILGHSVPVVGREAPVLAQDREVIRWCAGLAVHVEETRRAPGVDAEPADADRYVALEHDAMRVIACLAELAVQMILQEIMEVDLAAVRVDEGLDAGVVIDGILTPLRVVGSVVFLAEHAPRGVGEEPVLVTGHELLIVLAALSRAEILCEELAQILEFCVVDALIVDSLEHIELDADLLVVREALLILKGADSVGSQVHRVKRESRVGLVGIGVNPGAEHRGVVDGEDLKNLLSRLGAPVNHLLHVEEVADAEVIVSADGEYRYGGTRALPLAQGIGEACAVNDDLLARVLVAHTIDAVVHCFPADGLAAPVLNEELILERHLELR